MGGSTVGRGNVTPDSLVAPSPPPIQKLADGSDVISAVPEGSKIQIFRAPRTYNAPTLPLADGEGLVAPSQEPPAVCPSGLISTGLTHYRVGNPAIDRFQM